MKTIRPFDNESALDKNVRCWVNRQATGYDDVTGVFADLFHGGCQSGMVGHLIYYTDVVRFYKRHSDEIGRMLGETLSDTGCTVTELFGDKWEQEDPMAIDTFNQNLLAWFGFEEAARQLAGRLELDV